MRKLVGALLCLILVFTNIGFSLAVEAESETAIENSLEYLQYYVKWNDERAPEDYSITEAEYLVTEEKDKNNNGILDSLEEEEEDSVIASSIETGILGDLNGDSLVDNKDVILLYRHIAGWEQDINDKILDFNGDGYTNNNDAKHLLDYVSGWPNTTLYTGKKYDIIYHVLNESMYQGLEINNTNQDYYYSSVGYSLKNISVDGYIFEGWYDGEGESATRIRKIDVGETGEIELYARWTPRTYRIDFDSKLVPVESKYYTIETGAILNSPSLGNYIFVGWTKQEDGRLVNGVPKGAFGNMTLVANWASRRNLAKPVQNMGDPVIVEDSNNGRILFVYRLGDIENVPLFTLYRFSTAEGISSSVTLTEQTSISTSDARTISQTVANATTDSATWTLSEGWNENTSISQESLEQTGRTREEAETIARSSSNTYRLDSSISESEVIVDSSQYAFKGTVGTGSTSGTSVSNGQKYTYEVDRGFENETTLSTSAGIKGIAETKVEGTLKTHLDVNEGYERNQNVTKSSTDSWNRSIEMAGESASAKTSSKDWNSTSSYSNSNSLSNSHTTSEQISEMISEKYGYGQSYSKNGEHSSGQSFITENSQQNGYSNTVTYDTSTLYTKSVTYTTDGKVDGYYRQVLAGTAHVFGVVGYDIATRSYFVYTFTVMDDETYEFLDYSKSTPNFDDNEIGVLPFEIPVYVNEYINSRIARTEGLIININTGKVTGYTGEEKIVIIPSYVDINNGDGTYTPVKITGIETNAFRNNTNILGVMFSDFITDVPDSAFEGCTSLRDLFVPNLKSIGERAFYGCTSLSTLTIPTDVVSLGNNAFYNVNEVSITAANKNVALAAVNSGVKNLILNVSAINDEMKDAILNVPSNMNSFEIRGERKQYDNLRIKSNAGKTTINGINFANCTQVPMELHSYTVNLNQTSVSATGYCMILASNSTNMNLFGTNQMNSSNGNAIVCGNLALANSNNSVQASLQVSGNIYICGNIANQSQYLSQTNGSIIHITQEEFNQYISGVYQLEFNANGGSVQETEKIAYSGVAVGTLPTPTRTGYTFAGWYTESTGGTQVTSSSSFISSSSVTIYAQWIKNTYKLYFNANEGVCTTTSKDCLVDTPIGTLPTPTRDYYDFVGWFDKVNGGVKITPDYEQTTSDSKTVYAHWTEHQWSDWVDPSSVPQNARTESKTQYRYRNLNYTAWSDWGPWSDTRSSVNDAKLKEERTATVYGWYWFECPNCGARWHVYSGMPKTCTNTSTWGGCGYTGSIKDNWNVVWLTTSFSDGSVTQSWHGTGKKCLDTGAKSRVFAWTDGGSARTGYSYRTRTSYWGGWSEWSDTSITSTNERNVETRILMKYQLK